MATTEEQCLALAGVCQSAFLVKRLAQTGFADSGATEASLSSILVTQADSSQQIFGAVQNLKIGYQCLLEQLDASDKTKDLELTRYVASMISLERKLTDNARALNELSSRIAHVQRQVAHLDFDNAQVLRNLAAIYSDVISPLASKIQIKGKPQFLQVESSQQKIRALLLAGIRAAVLWRQLGGRRRHIIFKRKSIVENCRSALRSM